MLHALIYNLQILIGLIMFIGLMLYIAASIFFVFVKDNIRGYSAIGRIKAMRKLRFIKANFYSKLNSALIFICIIEICLIIMILNLM